MSQIISSEAGEWFESGNWKSGLQLEADPATDINEFFKQYHANTTGWDQAFAFFKNQDLENIRAGKHEIDGETVYASVSEGPNMDFDKTSWESHRKYNDIQYVIRGKEKIGITTGANATITKEYDEAQDIMFYEAEGTIHSFEPQYFFIFFPSDLHRPGIVAGSGEPVKKIVFKIRTAS